MINKIAMLLLLTMLSGCEKSHKTGQNPSPMEEYIRPHQRVDGSRCPGFRTQLQDIFQKPVSVFIPEHLSKDDTVGILLHFHGSPDVTEYASCSDQRKLVVITINLGSGSSIYEKPLQNDHRFTELLHHVKEVIQQNDLIPDRIIISGFSAGYGAIRAIISNPEYITEINGVLLLDGLHTDYQPEGKVLSNGGHLNTDKLEPFLLFAQLAVAGKKNFVFTHSSIFPGTFASTTECADYLISELGLSRTPVLKQGPLGMQLLGKTEKEGLKILAFAGNTAPDHIDHLHGLYSFLDNLLN